MPARRVFRITNNRVRLGVGLVLVGLFCIQCTHPDAERDAEVIAGVSGQTAGKVSTDRQKELEALARTDHVALLTQAIDHYRASYQDYTCTFMKAERIDGRQRPEQEIRVKFREKPFSVAMAWVRNTPMGDRVLYIEGHNDGNMLVRPTSGLLRALAGKAVSRRPDGPQAMANTLRPVTMFGFHRVMKNMVKVYAEAARRKEGTSEFLGYKELGGRQVMVLRRVLPARKDYPAKTTTWYLDLEHLVPLGLEASDWDDRPICRYLYVDVRFNVGLTDKDFSLEANEMK